MRLIDITGQRFGRLLVLRKLPPRPSKAGGSDWECVCDCGTKLTAIGSNLRSGDTRSCGCLAREWSSSMGANPDFIPIRIKKITKHGNKRRNAATVEYKTWLAIKRRCYDTKYKDYPNWGGRGIKVCDRWNHSFETFLSDMGPRPADKDSIDRKDVNGDYEPGNCRWATEFQQSSENRRNIYPITVQGKTFSSLSAACRHYGLPLSRVHYRIKNGIAPEKALSMTRLLPRRSKESYWPKSRRPT